MIWTALYGLVAYLVRRESSRRRDPVGEHLGMIMQTSWLITAVALALNRGHAADAVRIIAPADIGLALLVLVDGVRRPSERALWVFGLFAVELFVDGVSAMFGVLGAYAYWAVLNGVFCAQVIISGGAGVRDFIGHGIRHLRRRPNHSRPGGALAHLDPAP